MVREATNDGRDRRIAILVSMAGNPLCLQERRNCERPRYRLRANSDMRSAEKASRRQAAAAALDGISARETHVDLWSFCHWTPAGNTERALHIFACFATPKLYVVS